VGAAAAVHASLIRYDHAEKCGGASVNPEGIGRVDPATPRLTTASRSGRQCCLEAERRRRCAKPASPAAIIVSPLPDLARYSRDLREVGLDQHGAHGGAAGPGSRCRRGSRRGDCQHLHGVDGEGLLGAAPQEVEVLIQRNAEAPGVNRDCPGLEKIEARDFGELLHIYQESLKVERQGASVGTVPKARISALKPETSPLTGRPPSKNNPM